MEGTETPRRPGRGIWVAWGLAIVGGLGVLVAAVLAARAGETCVPGGPCAVRLPAAAPILAYGGTALAVLGGVVAAVLVLRRGTARPPG